MEEGYKHIDQRLLDLIDLASLEDGIFVDKLKAGDLVEIHTKNHVYTMKIINPETKEVEATSNSPHITEPTRTFANGSSLTGTGTMVKLGWIAVGYRFYLGNIFLSKTQKVVVNGVQILPRLNNTKKG